MEDQRFAVLITKQEPTNACAYTMCPTPRGTVIRVSEIAPESEEGDIYSLTPDQVRGCSGTLAAKRPRPSPWQQLSIHASHRDGRLRICHRRRDHARARRSGSTAQGGRCRGPARHQSRLVNRSDNVCRILFILCDGRLDPELAQLFKTRFRSLTSKSMDDAILGLDG